MDDNGLTIDVAPAGRNGAATLTARLAGDVLHVEKLDLGKSKQRAAFATAVCDGRPGIDRKALEGELLKLAAELASKPEEPPTDFSALPEIDASRIVRPERFVTPEVCGLAVPTMTTTGDRVAGRWQLYLRWADGRRERRPLGPSIDLPDGGRLYVHPEPSSPTPAMKPGWTAPARKRWLDGESPPNPADVFKRLCERVAYFLDLPRQQAPGITATLGCWVILTYCYLAWPAVPYLFVGGPLSSGKSRLFDVLARLVFRALTSSNMSAASLFRTLHSNGGTVLLDEAERLRNTRDPDVSEILSMLLAGHKAGGTATRLEPLGESGFRTVSFHVYAPKALACISGLPPALASRAIPIVMFRAGPKSPKPRRRIDADPGRWQRLRDDLHALVLEHGPTFLELPTRDNVCPEMSGRDFDKWQPLLAIGSWLQEAGALGLLGLMQEYALESIDAGRDDQIGDADEILLRILADKRANLETPQPKEILEAAQEAEPNGFRRWTAKGVANALRRYGLATNTYAGRRVYGKVTLADLARIENVYGLALGLPENAGEKQET